jgi:hypothetical protein
MIKCLHASLTASLTASSICIVDDSYRVASESVPIVLRGVLMGLGLLPCRGARGFSPCALGLISIMSTNEKKGDQGR